MSTRRRCRKFLCHRSSSVAHRTVSLRICIHSLWKHVTCQKSQVCSPRDPWKWGATGVKLRVWSRVGEAPVSHLQSLLRGSGSDLHPCLHSATEHPHPSLSRTSPVCRSEQAYPMSSTVPLAAPNASHLGVAANRPESLGSHTSLWGQLLCQTSRPPLTIPERLKAVCLFAPVLLMHCHQQSCLLSVHPRSAERRELSHFNMLNCLVSRVNGQRAGILER